MAKKKIKKKTLKKAHKDCWGWFSKYVRLINADNNGMVLCVDGCGKTLHWKKMNAGHYIHTGNSFANKIDFDTRNVHAQNPWCNTNMGQRHADYTDYMVSAYGQDVIDEIKQSKNKNEKYTIDELEVLTRLYKSKVEKLLLEIA